MKVERRKNYVELTWKAKFGEYSHQRTFTHQIVDVPYKDGVRTIGVLE